MTTSLDVLAQRLRATLRSLNEQAELGELTEARFRQAAATIRSVADELDAHYRAGVFGHDGEEIGADVIELAAVLARKGVRVEVPDWRGCHSNDLRLHTVKPVRPVETDDGGAA